MGRAKQATEETEEPSRAAGACVLVILGAAAMAGAFAIDEAAGVLILVFSGTVSLWRAARRMSDSSATPPPQEGRPVCRECAGHELVSVTPLAGQKGMLIYKTQPPDKPHTTHIHVVAGEVTD